jgi:hypothetical protein
MKTFTAFPYALLASLCLLTAACNPGPGPGSPSTSVQALGESKAQITMVFEGKDKLISQKGHGMVRLTVDGTIKGAGNVSISGPRYMVVQLDKEMSEALIYTPNGQWVYDLPAQNNKKDSIWRVLPPAAFAGDTHVMTARAATHQELAAYRNVAMNPYDVRGECTAFPHATSNSECRGEADFAARNAIDGHTQNNRHGPWPVQSWGPDQRTDLWWQADFGRPVEVDKVVLYIRADFPHDTYWHNGTIEFSDGSHVAISLEKNGAAQEFKFPKRATNYVKFTNLDQTKPLGWAGFTEVEAWGRDLPNAQSK